MSKEQFIEPNFLVHNELNGTIKLGEALEKLNGKIIGHNEYVGVYELQPMYQAGSNENSKVCGIYQKKFELERGTGENYMRFSYMSMQLRHLQGEILTIIEASIDDDRKLKAVKDLIKDKVSSKLSWIYENCGTPEEEQDALPE